MGAWRLESTHVFKQILNKAVSHPWCVLKFQPSKLRQRIKQNRLLSLFLIKICIWIRVEQILHLIYIVYSTLSTAFTRIRSRWLWKCSFVYQYWATSVHLILLYIVYSKSTCFYMFRFLSFKASVYLHSIISMHCNMYFYAYVHFHIYIYIYIE